MEKHNHDWEYKHPKPMKKLEFVLNKTSLTGDQVCSADVPLRICS